MQERYPKRLEMIKWLKIEAGEYKNEDGRFEISKTWDRIYSDHWELRDTTIEPYITSARKPQPTESVVG